jgi:hypothetical protein
MNRMEMKYSCKSKMVYHFRKLDMKSEFCQILSNLIIHLMENFHAF